MLQMPMSALRPHSGRSSSHLYFLKAAVTETGEPTHIAPQDPKSGDNSLRSESCVGLRKLKGTGILLPIQTYTARQINHMANAAYTTLEITPSLLRSYETLALDFKRRISLRASRSELGLPGSAAPVVNFENYESCFALISLNASIVEGALRSVLSEIILNDDRKATDQARAAGRTGPTNAEKLIGKFHSEVEMQGGWEKLLEQYSIYLGIKINEIVDADTKEGISVLFSIRNIIAHGTSFITPSAAMDDTIKDVYPYRWQTRLQQTSVYLERIFNQGDIYKNLAEDGVPKHFMDISRVLLKAVEQKMSPLPPRCERIFRGMNGYKFGFRSDF